MSNRWSIFISYRREDTEGYARFLHRLLLEWFDADEIYFDHQSNALGSDFKNSIQDAIESQAKVILVLVGKRWLGELIERAKTGEPDLVRFELDLALQRARAGHVTVIPVLTGNAPLPVVDVRKKRSMPEQVAAMLRELPTRHALPIFNESVEITNSQFERLLGLLSRTAGVSIPVPKMAQRGEEALFDLGGHQPSSQFEDPEGLLDQLRLRLVPTVSSDRVASCTVAGMAGTGKTELAMQFCLEHRSAFSGGIWWFPGSDESAFTAAVGRACRACLIPLAADDDVCIVWRQWLERSKRSWLLVVDDACRFDLVQRISPRFGPHCLLVTTLNRAANNVLEIEPWQEQQATAFLRKRLSRPSEACADGDLIGLARALGCLPLALTHAAAYLKATGLGVQQYRQSLEDVDAAPIWLDSRVGSALTHPVLATIGSALRLCTPDARRLLEALACFAAEPVPETWLRPLLCDERKTIGGGVEDEVRWNERVAELLALALVRRTLTYQPDLALGQEDPIAGRDRLCLQMNRLTQQAVLACLPTHADGRRAATSLLSLAAQAELMRPGRSAEYACLVPHLMFRATLDQEATAAQLLLTLYELHSHKGDQAAALDCAVRWLERCRSLFANDDPRIFHAEIVCAETCCELGRTRDADLHARRIVDACNSDSGVGPDLRARAACAMARSASIAGDIDGALQLYGDELVDRYLLGQVTPVVSAWLVRALGHLGATLSAAGRTAQALHTYQQLVEISEQVFGPWDESTLRAAELLALSLNDHGEAFQAADILQQVVQGRLRIHGPHHPETIEAQCALAEALSALSKFDLAMDVFEQARSAANLTLADDDARHGRIERGLEIATQAQPGADSVQGAIA